MVVVVITVAMVEFSNESKKIQNKLDKTQKTS